jgi:DNA topoisomerase-3
MKHSKLYKHYTNKSSDLSRVDTTFLPNDIYPKVSILQNLIHYAALAAFIGKKNKKSPKVLMTKVTDHHAIIPTGIQNNLQYNQQQVCIILLNLLLFMTIVLWPTQP